MNTLTINKTNFQAVNLFFHKLYDKFTAFKLTHFHKKADSDFTYDLEAMKKAVNQPKIKINKSDIENDDSFEQWLNS